MIETMMKSTIWGGDKTRWGGHKDCDNNRDNYRSSNEHDKRIMKRRQQEDNRDETIKIR